MPGSTGELLRIVALESTDRVETVFNFGVEEFYSYFVGKLGAWVHNCNKMSPYDLLTTERPKGRASQRKIDEIAQSMSENGWQGAPIKAVDVNGKLYIVDGHHRHRAAMKAGIDASVEVVPLSKTKFSTADELLSSHFER